MRLRDNPTLRNEVMRLISWFDASTEDGTRNLTELILEAVGRADLCGFSTRGYMCDKERGHGAWHADDNICFCPVGAEHYLEKPRGDQYRDALAAVVEAWRHDYHCCDKMEHPIGDRLHSPGCSVRAAEILLGNE